MPSVAYTWMERLFASRQKEGWSHPCHLMAMGRADLKRLEIRQNTTHRAWVAKTFNLIGPFKRCGPTTCLLRKRKYSAIYGDIFTWNWCLCFEMHISVREKSPKRSLWQKCCLKWNHRHLDTFFSTAPHASIPHDFVELYIPQVSTHAKCLLHLPLLRHTWPTSHCWPSLLFPPASFASEGPSQRRCSLQRHTPEEPGRPWRSIPSGTCQWPSRRGSWVASPSSECWWWS